MTHTDSFNRFCAQPIGRAKLHLLDYAQTHTDAEGRRKLAQYLRQGSRLSIRAFAALTESTSPNTSDFTHLIEMKSELWETLNPCTA